MKHLPILLISLFLIMSCEEDEEILGLVGTWNIESMTNLGNKDCTVDTSSTSTDSTVFGIGYNVRPSEFDFGEYSGTITFTDSTVSADYNFSFYFEEYCEMMGGTWSIMEGVENSCTIMYGNKSLKIEQTGFDEDICLGIDYNYDMDDDVEEWPDATISWDPDTGDSICNHNMTFEAYYTLDGSVYCEFDDKTTWEMADSLNTGSGDDVSCGTVVLTKDSATITMPNHENNECDIIELTK